MYRVVRDRSVSSDIPLGVAFSLNQKSQQRRFVIEWDARFRFVFEAISVESASI